MLYSKIMKRLRLPALVLAFALTFSGTVLAQYTSSNYKANEVYFGSGGGTGSSTNYQAQQSLGSLGVGRYSSTNYQAFGGFLTPNEPFLEFQIDTASPVDLGTLDTSTAKTATAAFHVRAYLNSGYIVETLSNPPTYSSGTGTHTLAGMSLGSSSPGTEQFGINLRANTSPATFGADPAPQPNKDRKSVV